MKNGIAVALLFVGLISVILGIVCFSMENGSKEFYYSYGGDAYTGMQQAAAQGANNGYYGNNILCLGFGSVLTVAGMVIMLLAINSILKNEFGGGGSAEAGDSASGGLVDKSASIEEMMRTGAYGAGSAAAGIPAPAASGREPSFPAPATPRSSAPAAVKPVPISSAPVSVKTAPAPVVTVPSDEDFKYSVNGDGTVRIMKYTGKSAAVQIPENLFGKPVTSLGDFAFSGNAKVTDIIVPGSVKSIGGGVFANCGSIRRIVLPNGIPAITSRAFYVCRSLTDIRIPESVTRIDKFAFANCISLKEINIPGGVTSIGDNAFSGCPDLTVTVTPGSYGEQYCISNGLKYRYAD